MLPLPCRADQASLNLFVALCGDRELKHILIIGAFRDSNIGEHHPLSLALANIRAAANVHASTSASQSQQGAGSNSAAAAGFLLGARVPLTSIQLGSLPGPALLLLLADTLKSDICCFGCCARLVAQC